MKERLLLKNETIPIIPNHVRFEYNEVRKRIHEMEIEETVGMGGEHISKLTSNAA